MPISYFIPAYNCQATLEASVASILHGNFEPGDELLITDDGSTDDTPRVLAALAAAHPELRVLWHPRNLGGGAARNTCVRHARHALLFCLDSDNLLAPGSVRALREFMERERADVAAFGELHYFMDDPAHVSHSSAFQPEPVTLADCLSKPLVPGSSGNYLFTRDSWIQAGGYPETARALDAWGFGLRQVATGARMLAMPDSHYYHRIGHASYYVREARRNDTSHLATRLLLPFLDLIEPEDVSYLRGELGREFWFSQLDERPVRVKPAALDAERLRARACLEPPDRIHTLLEERLVEPGTHGAFLAFAGRLWSETTHYPCPDGVPVFSEPRAPLEARTTGSWACAQLEALALPALPTIVHLGAASAIGLDTPYAYVVTGTPAGPNTEGTPPHRVIAEPEALPFAAESVDVVVSLGTLEAADNPLKTLIEIHRVLKPDGLCLLEVPRQAAMLDPEAMPLDTAFAEWYLEPLFEPVAAAETDEGRGMAWRKRQDGRLWITDDQLQALGDRIATYRRAHTLAAAGDGPGSLERFRSLAMSDTLLPAETPRRAYALLQVAAAEHPEAARSLRAALALIGGTLAEELVGTAAPSGNWESLRERLDVPGLVDGATVLGVLAQLAQASGQEALASELADWSVSATA